MARDGKEWWRRFIELANRLNLSYWAIRLSMALARLLPLRVSYAITITASYLVYFAWGGMRQVVSDNMRRVLGEAADSHTVQRMVQAAFRNYFKYFAELLRLPHLGREELEKLIPSSTGWEHLDRALQEGKGVIFCGFHIGNWDLAGAVLALRGYPLNVVVDTFQPPKLNELIQRFRKEKGVKTIPIEQAKRKTLETLHQKEILGLLIDRPSLHNGVPVEFFGATTRVPAGAAALALKTGAALLPGYIVRRPDNTFEGAIAPPLEVQPTGDFQGDVQRVMQRLMDCLEGWVRQYPDQWHMFRRMWPQEAT